MENELRKILLETASAFANASGCAISTLGKLVKNDPNFFTRITEAKGTFTVRTYDEVMAWCATNWPAGKHLPLGLMKWMAETGHQQVSA